MAGVQERLKVTIVEDEDLFRDLLQTVLCQQPHLHVIGAFADSESALRAIPDLQPRVALLDIELRSARNGIQLGLLLRQRLPDLGIVLLSNYQDLQFFSAIPYESIAGWSYLLKKSVSNAEVLNRAIEAAAAGLVVLDSQLVMHPRSKVSGRLGRLTPRQRDILSLMASGLTNLAIAKKLFLSEKTLENQINALYQQLEISGQDPSVQPRVKAVLFYLQETGSLSRPSP